jgi:hypothetical protein
MTDVMHLADACAVPEHDDHHDDFDGWCSCDEFDEDCHFGPGNFEH